MAIDPNQIQLTEELKEQLARKAEETGRPWTEVFSEAVRTYRPPRTENAGAEDESLYDSMNRHGLIGCIKGGPSDLSTNHKYMEGFGESDNETGSD